MTPNKIILLFVVIDDVLQQLEHRTHILAKVSDAEIILTAIIAQRYFQGNQALALETLQEMEYIPMEIKYSRYNRRLKNLKDLIILMIKVLSELNRTGNAYIIDSMPLPLCKYARSHRCKKQTGKLYFGQCPAKKENFLGIAYTLCVPHKDVPLTSSLSMLVNMILSQPNICSLYYQSTHGLPQIKGM